MKAPFSDNKSDILKNIEEYKSKIATCNTFQDKSYQISLLRNERKKLNLCEFPPYCKFSNQNKPILHSDILASKNSSSSSIVKMAVEQAKTGVTPDFVRLSIGTEDSEDLIADLKQALDAV